MQLKEMIGMLRAPVFRQFVIPNALRGITLGVTNSIALIALAMGIPEADASMLPIMIALAAVASSIIYRYLDTRVKLPTIGIIGSILLCAIVFLPRGNTWLFMLLFFVAYTGRRLVDDIIPVMVLNIIDPAVSGTYNAWRSVVLYLANAVTVYVVGHLLEFADPMWLLIPCVLAYLVSMVWHTVLYNRFQSSRTE